MSVTWKWVYGLKKNELGVGQRLAKGTKEVGVGFGWRPFTF